MGEHCGRLIVLYALTGLQLNRRGHVLRAKYEATGRMMLQCEQRGIGNRRQQWLRLNRRRAQAASVALLTFGAARCTWIPWLVVIAALLPCAVSAEETPSPPTPHEVSDLIPEAGEPLIEPISHQVPVQHGAMSNWDLYAGSVYANTSPLWVHAEGFVGWIRGNELPALVTTSPFNTDRDDAGVIGTGDTSILFGNDRVDDRTRGGFRASMGVRLGHWFDHLMDSELEFGVLWVGDGQSSGDFYAASSGDPILARPFFDVDQDTPNAQLIAYPGVVWGDICIETSSEFLTTGALLRRACLRRDHVRLDWLAGYRYAQFKEALLIREFLVSTDPNGDEPVGTAFDVFDNFRTWNEFHGADLGLQLWTGAHGWTLEVLGKVALGAVFRTVQIDGETFTTRPDEDASFVSGGLLALPTNIGRHQSSQFSVLPELTIRLRRPISRFFTFTCGYTALLVNNVMRTGDQVDLALNPTQIGGEMLVGAARPAVPLKDATVWVHGFTAGLEW